MKNPRAFNNRRRKMTRTKEEVSRDETIINLLKNIWSELKKLNKNMENKNASK